MTKTLAVDHFFNNYICCWEVSDCFNSILCVDTLTMERQNLVFEYVEIDFYDTQLNLTSQIKNPFFEKLSKAFGPYLLNYLIFCLGLPFFSYKILTNPAVKAVLENFEFGSFLINLFSSVGSKKQPTIEGLPISSIDKKPDQSFVKIFKSDVETGLRTGLQASVQAGVVYLVCVTSLYLKDQSCNIFKKVVESSLTISLLKSAGETGFMFLKPLVYVYSFFSPSALLKTSASLAVSFAVAPLGVDGIPLRYFLQVTIFRMVF